MEKFVPQSHTKVDSVRHINYTCSPERYAELEQIAKNHNVGLKELLRQMVEFSMKSL